MKIKLNVMNANMYMYNFSYTNEKIIYTLNMFIEF